MPLPFFPAKRKFLRALLKLCVPPLLAALAGTTVFGATIVTEEIAARAGDTVASAVRLLSGEEVLSGLQFDLEADPSLHFRVGPGSALPASAKLLVQASPLPGVTRILIVGINRIPLPNQNLIQLFITIAPNAPPFVATIGLRNPIATTPDGAQAPLTAGTVSIRILNGPATQILPPSGVLNAASLQPGPVSPGELVTLFGSLTSAEPSLLFNGIRAPILYAGPGQVNAMVPYELEPDTPATLELIQGPARSILPVIVTDASPALFTSGSGGTGQGAILNQDYSANSPSSPAVRGSTVMLFGTGFGRLDGPSQQSSIQFLTSRPVTAMINAAPAEVTYAGAAPGLPPGVVQVNVRIPESLAADPYAAVSLQIADRTTPPGVTVSIR